MKCREVIFAFSLALSALGIGAAAFAGGPPPPPAPTPSPSPSPTTVHPIKGVTWQELQGRCEDPNNWPDLQGVVPSDIQIECGNIERTWVPEEPGAIALSADRQVAAAVSATKFTVASEIKALNVAASAGACPKFKEVVRTSHVVIPVDCGQVIGFKGDPIDFCQNLFDSGKGTGPKETVTTETGRKIDSCGAQISGDPKPVD